MVETLPRRATSARRGVPPFTEPDGAGDTRRTGHMKKEPRFGGCTLPPVVGSPNPDTPMVNAWMCGGKGWGSLIDLAQSIERERNILLAAITEAVARFDKLSWGWDGDCGTGNIMRELEEARDKVCTSNPTGQRTGAIE